MQPGSMVKPGPAGRPAALAKDIQLRGRYSPARQSSMIPMTFLVVVIGLLVAVALVGFGLWFATRPSIPARPVRGSIMDAELEGISLFSADHVRMLSETQLRTIEREAEEEA